MVNLDVLRGEKNPSAKLTWEKVDAIRAAWDNKVLDQKQLAAQYGVTESTIHKIVNRYSWHNENRLKSGK